MAVEILRLVIALVIVGAVLLVFSGVRRLMALAGYERRWRAFIPLWNLLVMIDMAGKERFYIVWFFIPLLNLAAMPYLLGEIAFLTGRPKWLGWILGFYAVALIGIPYIAFTAPANNKLFHEYDTSASSESGDFKYRYQEKEG